MGDIRHEDFVEILNIVKNRLDDIIDFEEISSIESNFDTKAMMFKRKSSSLSDGTIIVGEDNGLIVADISKADGEVVSFIIEDLEDEEGIDNVVLWMKDNYS